MVSFTGIGYSLREARGSTEKKDFLLKTLPNVNYDLIMKGQQSITKEQALFLYDVSLKNMSLKGTGIHE